MITQIKLQTEEYKETELGLLPKEWEVAKIINIIDFQRGTEVGSDTYNKEDRGIRFLRVVDVSGSRNEIIYTTSKNIKECNENDVLITFDGSPGVVRKGLSGAYSSGIRKVVIKSDKVLLDFVYYVLITPFVQKTIQKYSVVVTIKHASKSIPHIKIPLPPLPEQKSIAFVLSTIQTAKEKTEQVIKATKELKKSMMKHLFTYGPVSLEEAEKVKLKETEIGMIPEEWEVVKVKDVFEFTKKPRDLDIKENDEILFIPMEFISESNKSVTWQLKKHSKISSGTFVFKNDLIIAKITPCFENGKQAILSNIPNDYAYATTEVWALHPKNGKVINEHLYEILKIPEIRINLAGKMEGTTGRQRLPKHVLANFKFPLPPLPTQQKIASILSVIDEKIQAEENKKKALEDLFKSMLHNLMTGRIRVKDLNFGVENV